MTTEMENLAIGDIEHRMDNIDIIDDTISSEVSFDESCSGQRWDPLGAPNDESLEIKSEEHHSDCLINQDTKEKLLMLEEEQDLLNSSLFALTTHFAQVQFRLRQVVNAPHEDKEELLKSLEEFAFRGIPDVGLVKEKMDEASLAEAVCLRRNQQKELIDRLKSQLRELEQYAFENGEAGVPQDIVLERQRAILNELKCRMNLELDEEKFHRMSTADVKQQINLALEQLVSPLKIKEHLVAQLKTQVADLERFINYLQADSRSKTKKCSCGCALHSVKNPRKSDSVGIIQRTATLLQMFALLQQGGMSHFRKNNLKNTMKGNHWGDLRAKLEMSIIRVKEIAQRTEANKAYYQGDYYSDSECHSVNCDIQLTNAVRKHLAISLRDLIQHGALASYSTSSIVPLISCFPHRISSSDAPIHAWEIILDYYHLKNGASFNSAPVRKLSQSFNLDIAGTSSTSNKHTLLACIGNILSSHMPYKRSLDSHFKAFVCAALNANKLVAWLSLIIQNSQLVETHYLPWSYVVKTGFQDSLRSLDALTHLQFDLPVDLAVRQFQNIKDVFT